MLRSIIINIYDVLHVTSLTRLLPSLLRTFKRLESLGMRLAIEYLEPLIRLQNVRLNRIGEVESFLALQR